MISFAPLRRFLAENGKNFNTLTTEIGFSRETTNRLRNELPVSMETIDRLCTKYGLTVGQVMRWQDDNV